MYAPTQSGLVAVDSVLEDSSGASQDPLALPERRQFGGARGLESSRETSDGGVLLFNAFLLGGNAVLRGTYLAANLTERCPAAAELVRILIFQNFVRVYDTTLGIDLIETSLPNCFPNEPSFGANIFMFEVTTVPTKL